MGPDRLSPLDASFLHLEDHVSPHAHRLGRHLRRAAAARSPTSSRWWTAKLDLVPRYRQKVRFVPLELGRPVWVDDPHFNIEYHLRHTALPAPGGESELRKPGGAGHGTAARPLQAAVGDLGGRGPRGRALGDLGQDAPRAGRRRVGDRPAGSDHGPEPRAPSASGTRRSGRRTPSPSAPSSAVEALEHLVQSPYEQLRAARAQTRAASAGPRATLGEVASGALRAQRARAAHRRPRA